MAMVLLLAGGGDARQAAPAGGGAALTLSIKGSTAYAKPEPVPAADGAACRDARVGRRPAQGVSHGSRQTTAGTLLFGSRGPLSSAIARRIAARCFRAGPGLRSGLRNCGRAGDRYEAAGVAVDADGKDSAIRKRRRPRGSR
jgi:hypothetical protein